MMQTTIDWFGPRAVARGGDPDTSHEAAASITGEAITATQNAILAVLDQLAGACDDSIARLYRGPRTSPSGLRTRRKELFDRGYVEAVGTVKLPSGRRATVWGITEAGRERLSRA